MKKKLLVIEDESSVAKQLRWGLDKDYRGCLEINAVCRTQALNGNNISQRRQNSRKSAAPPCTFF